MLELDKIRPRAKNLSNLIKETKYSKKLIPLKK